MFTGAEQRWARPRCPLVPVPASSHLITLCEDIFWVTPLVPHGPGGSWDAPALPPDRGPLESLCMAPLEAINFPEHGAQTYAPKSAEALLTLKCE